MKKIFLLLFFFLPLAAQAASLTVLINEIAWMGTINSSNDEWFELYNPTDEDIDLTGWRLEAIDGSPKIELDGSISAGGYFLLERTDDETLTEITADQIYAGSLSNTGEWLKLCNPTNELVDELNATAGWPGGNNTTKQTLERSSTTTWQTSLEVGGSPKNKNSTAESNENEIPLVPTDETQPVSTNVEVNPKVVIKKGEIIINEILPNPEGLDLELEFIELKNASQRDIDLTSWQIKTSQKQVFVLPSLKMTPKSIVVFYRSQTKLALNNNKEKISLYTQDDNLVDQAEYKTTALGDLSWQKDNENKMVWWQISPGQENSAQAEVLPVAQITGPKEVSIGQIVIWEASDSFDPKNRPLRFFWNFGNGRTDQGVLARQIYTQPGDYEIKLTALAEGQASSTAQLKVKVKTEGLETSTTTTTTTPLLINRPDDSTNDLNISPAIFISEFLPNPDKNLGQEEFIEIFNQENKTVNLAGWQLDDAEKGSRPYTIPQGTIIGPGEYLAFFGSQTKIALNNDQDEVRLIIPNGQIYDLTSYEKTKAGQSYILDPEFVWQTTQTPTPNEVNVLDPVESTTTEKINPVDGKVLGTRYEAPKEGITNFDWSNLKPKSLTKYLMAGGFTIFVLGLFLIIKKVKIKI